MKKIILLVVLIALFVLLIIQLLPFIVPIFGIVFIYLSIDRFFQYLENIKGFKKEKKTFVNDWAKKYLKENVSKKRKQNESINEFQ